VGLMLYRCAFPEAFRRLSEDAQSGHQGATGEAQKPRRAANDPQPPPLVAVQTAGPA